MKHSLTLRNLLMFREIKINSFYTDEFECFKTIHSDIKLDYCQYSKIYSMNLYKISLP